MDEIKRCIAAGQQAQGFFLFCLGALISGVLGYIGLTDASAMQTATYAGAGIALAVATAWFGLEWRREVRQQRTVFDRIQGRVIPFVRQG